MDPQPFKYKRHKWFIGAIIIGVAVTVIAFANAGVNDWGVLMLPLYVMAIAIYWPVDYLISKHTYKQLHDPNRKIDPRARLKWWIFVGGTILIMIAANIYSSLTN